MEACPRYARRGLRRRDVMKKKKDWKWATWAMAERTMEVVEQVKSRSVPLTTQAQTPPVSGGQTAF